MPVARSTPPAVDGVELAEVVGDPLVGDLGQRQLLDLPTVTTKSAGSGVPFGVVVNVSSSPADAPTSCSSKSSATQPWPIS